jgi:hypothetical protein
MVKRPLTGALNDHAHRRHWGVPPTGAHACHGLSLGLGRQVRRAAKWASGSLGRTLSLAHPSAGDLKVLGTVTPASALVPSPVTMRQPAS